MATATRSPLLSWTTAVPILALVVLGLTWGRHLPTVLGRATRLQGAVHLVLLAAFLFLAVNP